MFLTICKQAHMLDFIKNVHVKGISINLKKVSRLNFDPNSIANVTQRIGV